MSTFKLFKNKQTLYIKIYHFACDIKDTTTFLISYIPWIFHSKLFCTGPQIQKIPIMDINMIERWSKVGQIQFFKSPR